MKERAENLWVDDHTLYLDIQTLSYNAHQAPCHCVYGVYFSVLFVGWQILFNLTSNVTWPGLHKLHRLHRH